MKTIRCDYCKRTDDPITYGSSAYDTIRWLTVQIRLGGSYGETETCLDACSFGCAVNIQNQYAGKFDRNGVIKPMGFIE